MQKEVTHFKKARPISWRAAISHIDRIDKPPVATIATSQIPLLAEEWHLNSESKSLAADSLRENRTLVGRLVWFLEREGLMSCGTRELRLFFAYMPEAHLLLEGRWGNPDSQFRKKLSKTTLRTYHARLRPFFSFLVNEDVLGVNPMDRVEKPGSSTAPIAVFNNAQMEAMFRQVENTLTPRRNILILRLLLHTGIRAEELLTLRLQDIDMATRRFKVMGKGAKERYLRMGRRTSSALYAYLRHYNCGPGDPLFPSATGHGRSLNYGLTYNGLREMISNLGQKAGIKVVRDSPHTFRHTWATAFYQKHKDLARLQMLLGHGCIAMSMRYVSVAQLEDEIDMALDE